MILFCFTITGDQNILTIPKNFPMKEYINWFDFDKEYYKKYLNFPFVFFPIYFSNVFNYAYKVSFSLESFQLTSLRVLHYMNNSLQYIYNLLSRKLAKFKQHEISVWWKLMLQDMLLYIDLQWHECKFILRLLKRLRILLSNLKSENKDFSYPFISQNQKHGL